MHTHTVLQENESGQKVTKSLCDAISDCFSAYVTRDSWPFHLVFPELLQYALTPTDRRLRRNTHEYQEKLYDLIS